MKTKILIWSVLSLLIITSCNKATVGEDLLPGGDKLNVRFNDTTRLVAKTIRESAMRSDRLLINHIGSMDDPIFGKTTALLATEIGLPFDGFTDTIGGYTLDSVVLNLDINNFYGDESITQSFIVYKQVSVLDKSSVHYSNGNIPINMLEIGRIDNYQFTANTFQDDNDEVLSGQLYTSFGNELLSLIGTDTFASNDTFSVYLPGIVIVPDTSSFGGGIAGISLNASASNITLHYKNSEDTVLTSRFGMSVSGFNIDQYNHDYIGTEVATNLNNEGEAFNYLQGLAGLKTCIEFPDFEDYGDITILKGEIQITQVFESSNSQFIQPARLFALSKSDSTDQDLSDYSFFGSNHLDGFENDTVDASGNTVYRYKINISDYLQDILLGKVDNDGIVITNTTAQIIAGGVINPSLYFADRIKFGGTASASSDYRLKLLLKYTTP